MFSLSLILAPPPSTDPVLPGLNPLPLVSEKKAPFWSHQHPKGATVWTYASSCLHFFMLLYIQMDFIILKYYFRYNQCLAFSQHIESSSFPFLNLAVYLQMSQFFMFDLVKLSSSPNTKTNKPGGLTLFSKFGFLQNLEPKNKNLLRL